VVPRRVPAVRPAGRALRRLGGRIVAHAKAEKWNG
jgi:hypothetical protein